MEDLPYLEILCVSDATSNAHQSLEADGPAQEEEVGSATKSPHSYEKQGSLIALAWSKPPENDTDCEAGAAVGGTGLVQSSDTSSTAEHTQCDETSGESDREELKPTRFHSDSTGHHNAQSADQQCSTVRQVLCKCQADHKTFYYCHASDFSPFIFSLVDIGGESNRGSTREGRI